MAVRVGWVGKVSPDVCVEMFRRISPFLLILYVSRCICRVVCKVSGSKDFCFAKDAMFH